MKKNREDSREKSAGLNLISVLKKADVETTALIIVSTIVLTVWVYYGKQDAFYRFFPGIQNLKSADFYATIYEYVSAFILMFVLPLVLVSVITKTNIREYGLRAGNVKYGLRFVAIALPVVVLIAFLGSMDKTMINEYPLAKSVIGRPGMFVVIEFFYLIYYISWEFLFRGVMLFSVERVYGPVAAILVQLIPSALVHIGKPASESFGAIIGGLIFGYLAIRTRSFIYPLILHACLGIFTDLFTMLQRLNLI